MRVEGPAQWLCSFAHSVLVLLFCIVTSRYVFKVRATCSTPAGLYPIDCRVIYLCLQGKC